MLIVPFNRLRGQPHPDPASHTAEVHPSYNSHPVPLAEHNTSAGHITDQATPPTMLSATGGLGEMKKKGRSASYPPSLALQINTPNISPRQVFSGGTDECLPTSIYTWAEALHRDTRLRSPPLLGFNATRSRPDEEIKARLANITELMQSMQSSHEAYMANSIRIIFEMEAMALQKVQDIKQARGEGDGGVDIDGLGTSVDPVAMAPSDS